MASRRRRRKSIGKVIVDVERRVRRVEKRPGAKRLKRNVVTTEKLGFRAVTTKVIQVDAVETENIATDAVTFNEAAFGVNVVSDTEPGAEYLKPGTQWTNPNTSEMQVYDAVAEEFIPVRDPAAQLTADGKNAIYSQTTAPTGGTYAVDDLWFDTDDGNKLYRYVLSTTSTVSNKALTNNFATLTTSGAHGFVIGQSVTVSGVDATFNGTYTVTVTTATTFTYAKTATNVVSVSSSGSVTGAAGWISTQDTAIAAAAAAAVIAQEAADAGAAAALAAQNTADGKNKIYRQTTEPTGETYAVGDTWFDTDGDNAIYRYASGSTGTVSKKALTGNVATLTTTAAHSFTRGESITVSGVDATFNGTYTVTAVPTSTTLTYAKTATNVVEIASSGTITSSAGWKALVLGSNAITSISATQISTGTLAAGVIYSGSINANQISTGTIAANIVYAGTVNANQINAGTLAAGVIYSGSITTSQMTAGTLTAGTIYTGAIAASQITAGTITATVSLTSATLQTTNYASGTGVAIKTVSGAEVIDMSVGGASKGTITAVAGGLVINSGAAQLTLTAAGNVQLVSQDNTLTMSQAPFLTTSGSNVGGSYGSLRNTFASSNDPAGGGAGDVWLKWV